METRTFRTNLTCGNCVAKVTPFLNSDPDIANWKVDLNKSEKPLTVTAHHVDVKRVRELVKKSGFEVFEEINQPTVQSAAAPYSIQQPINEPEKSLKTYFPLALIFGYLIIGIFIIAVKTQDFSITTLMSHFMGGFFLIFSFFKLISLKGFAESYRSYDVVAKRSITYSYAYPFIELFLGLAYLANFAPLFTNLATVIVMAVSSIGVVKSVAKKQKIRCACLGTMFNLPMSTITLLEDLFMLVMALSMTALLLQNGTAMVH